MPAFHAEPCACGESRCDLSAGHPGETLQPLFRNCSTGNEATTVSRSILLKAESTDVERAAAWRCSLQGDAAASIAHSMSGGLAFAFLLRIVPVPLQP